VFPQVGPQFFLARVALHVCVNPRTGQPYKKMQSGVVRVEWHENLRDKKKGIYRVRRPQSERAMPHHMLQLRTTAYHMSATAHHTLSRTPRQQADRAWMLRLRLLRLPLRLRLLQALKLQLLRALSVLRLRLLQLEYLPGRLLPESNQSHGGRAPFRRTFFCQCISPPSPFR